MMMSPEAYYENYIKGKSKEEIQAEIRSLEQEIMEAELEKRQGLADDGSMTFPTPWTRVSVCSEYLVLAKLELDKYVKRY